MSRQAYALDVLLAEVNKHAPGRSKASDGGLASSDHTAANPTSDHEALDGVAWTARDFTDDPAGGLDGSELAQKLAHRIGKHPALGPGSYVIHNARIISHARLAEGWRPYSGYNAHRQHVHLSVSDARSGYDNRTPWNLWAAAEPKPVAPTRVPTMLDITIALERLSGKSTNLRAIALYASARKVLGPLVTNGDREVVPTSAASIIKHLDDRRTNTGGATKARLTAAIALLRPLA